MEAAAGYTLDDAAVGLAHAVYRETDGNPFFVSEVLRHLSETGAIYQDATGRWTAEDSLDQMALPDSVREVISARVGRLGQDAGRVLSMAAVIGRDFDLDLLARATRPPRTSCSTSSMLPLPRPWCANWPTPRAITTSPTPSSSTPCTRTSDPPVEPGRIELVAEALEDLCGDRPGARSRRTGPSLGQRHPTDRPGQGHRLLPPGGRRRARAPWPPPTPSATTPRPSTSTPRADRPRARPRT